MILLLASKNKNKKKEMQLILPPSIEIMDLNDLEFEEDIEETGKTLKENAILKAQFLYQKLKVNCIAEDSGLEVEFLEGNPGVYSARYAGPQKNDLENIKLLLDHMKTANNRNAQFRTVIAGIINNQEFTFEGIIKGKIANISAGNSGFGYDPIFIPEFFDQTFAELGEEIKSKISHRSRAVQKLLHFLQSYQ
ncbi:MAG: RdgB/HAM1 family non-canonical purine NTP pyrophosphatase [Saprospiraceae bacterium]|nr:RdgB/HAM1 family non-canonical purine NTP pyrophosphatase [Saprospiraceae bacterium]MBK8484704.1 RdgB/HAM1 family non-canonical purine NTP pyrophosphatase [Saprospiraceae bacterium]MBK9720959.1 RdgB/HAM1 family non-canonical purine NTP pyrophosphatase [Saprospiraceae bacterium]MBK9727953.1 RdgB/HAM1 family non-canonical purine NTP pyrophosphatase [Saprospiraceae bacterium]